MPLYPDDPAQISWRDQQGRLAALVDEAFAWREHLLQLQRDLQEACKRADDAQHTATRSGLVHIAQQALEHLLMEVRVYAAAPPPTELRMTMEREHVRRTYKANERMRRYMATLRRDTGVSPRSQSQVMAQIRREMPEHILSPAAQASVDAIIAQGVKRTPEEQAADEKLIASLRQGAPHADIALGQTPQDVAMLERYNAKQKGKGAKVFALPTTFDEPDPNAPLFEVAEDKQC